MSVLLLRLAAPMQAWGARSRFTVRETETAPTKSGILGMLAAAAGRRRTDPIEDLLTLRFGVRKDQPGRVIRDYHTAHPAREKHTTLSERYYLADAVFLAGLEGDEGLVSGLDDALRHPVFPLDLGRRSCPPAQPVSLGLRGGGLLAALEAEPWIASDWFRRRSGGGIDTEIVIDAESVPADGAVWDAVGSPDLPVSFDPRHRKYAYRQVQRVPLRLGVAAPDPHDPMAVLTEVAP